MSIRHEIACRVVKNRQAEKLPEGQLLDLFTASALVNLYEALSETNRARFDSAPLDKLITLAFTGKAS